MTVLQIDRAPASAFDPVAFSWTFGKSSTITEEDGQALKLTEVDLSKVILESALQDDEDYLTAEEKMRRLKDCGVIRLDAKVLQVLWENQHLIPSSWKKRVNGFRAEICFDGTILLIGGQCAALALSWMGGEWSWRHFRWFRGRWIFSIMYLKGNAGFRSPSTPSAVLAS